MTEEIKVNKIAPQDGFQMMFASSSADIVIGGSGAGVGKTFSLLIDPLKHITRVAGFGGVIFRRTTPQIRNEGGLWDKSLELYSKIKGSKSVSNFLTWFFKVKGSKLKNKISFKHLQHEKDIYEWQGSEIAYIGFDELTHFTRKMALYLLTRNRSTCGVKPYFRATCNPDPFSWVKELLVSGGYVDDKTGYPIPEMEGIIKYMVVDGNGYIWGESYQDCYEKAKHILDPLINSTGFPAETFIKSFTFISGSIYDNKKLLTTNPEYLGNLVNQDEQTKSELLDKNWNIKESNENIFNFSKLNQCFEKEVKKSSKRLICDIALLGSNKFVIGYFEGRLWQDCLIIPKSNGKEVIEAIIEMANKYEVDNESILYDSDGLGGFVGGEGGFIDGSISFHSNGAVLEVIDEKSNKKIKENYGNLKSQLVFRCGKAVDNGLYGISEKVSNMMYDDKMTFRQRLIYEARCFKKAKTGPAEKIRVISKDDMKKILEAGESPDLMDVFYMNEYFEISPERDMSVWY